MSCIVFRTDASLTIGTGHVMRCLALASDLRRYGVSILFVCREHKGHLCNLIREHDFAVRSLPPSNIHAQLKNNTAHDAWLGASWQLDAEQTRAELDALGEKPDWLVVDHYAINRPWESALRTSVKHIMAIDDLADRIHDCDLLLDQNFYINMDARYDNMVPEHCRLLLGPNYALLRPEFKQQHEKAVVRSCPIKRILISFGGVDDNNYTGCAIEGVASLGLKGLAVDVVIGSQHPCLEKIENECKRHGFKLHIQTDRMARLMAAADLAIGAGGSTVWERCCLGLPAIVISVAQNQHPIASDLAKTGAIYYLGPSDMVDSGAISAGVERLMASSEQMMAMSRAGMKLVDGKGANRIAEYIVNN